MQEAPIPKNEKERLEALKRLQILDTPKEPRFDKLTNEAVARFDVPISTITLVDENREWFKSCKGMSCDENPRNISFCGHALLANDVFIVEDTLKDERFKDNPQVINAPFIRFYAGVVLRERTNFLPIGVFCIKDTKSRKFLSEDIGDLLSIAQRAEDELNKDLRQSTITKSI